MSDIIVRAGSSADLGAINAIYNYYVLHSTCTYQTEPETAEARAAWFVSHGAPHPIVVAEMDDRIVGWGSLSRFHPRAAYGRTVENSIYVQREFQRRGLGSAILVDLIARARALGHHTIIAGIDAEQEGSIAIHAKHGFVPVGHLREVGYKFNRWLHVIDMQLML